jgi:ATP-dependent Clp protease, protease subunit
MLWKLNINKQIKEVELRHNPVIIRVNKFTEESAKEFASQMALAHNTGQSVIPIVIDSYGGQVYSLMSMIASIKSSELPVATIIEGKAMSCGAVLFTFGEEGMRYIDPDATIMIHDVSSSSWGKVEEIKASAAETERLNKKIYTQMARNCGHSDTYFIDEVHKRGRADWYITAEESKKLKLSNHLRTPRLEVNIEVDFKFS